MAIKERRRESENQPSLSESPLTGVEGRSGDELVVTMSRTEVWRLMGQADSTGEVIVPNGR